MTERIIVSMTSYPKRIGNIGKSIYALFNKQIMKPDAVHLWLSEEEFPNKENDLPEDLVLQIETNQKIFIHWLKKNTYVHKRHEYFKIANENDCVFFLDDDVFYDNKLIKTVMDMHNQIPNCIICYNQYNPHLYNGIKILYKNNKNGNGPFINKLRWCGQSMIPAKLYPKYILSDELQKIRDKTSPISDECWFQPWVVYNNIPIYYFNFGWGTDINKATGKNTGICSFSHKTNSAGFEKRDIWLNNVLTAIPELLKKYKKEFNYG